MAIQYTHHMAVALGVFEQLNDKTLRDVFEPINGKKPSVKDIRAHLKEMRDKGFKYYPMSGCDNYNSEGACIGHDKMSKP